MGDPEAGEWKLNKTHLDYIAEMRKVEPKELDWRLVNGNTLYDGRPEVYHLGEWGTVCDDYFNIYDAHMICHSLGFTGASIAHSNAVPFGQGTGRIWLDDVSCPQGATALGDCTHNGFGYHNCLHAEDVGVTGTY